MNKYDKPMMETALVWSDQSHCRRNQVGAVISKNERVISNGYNGTISGADNNCEEITEEECSNCNGRGYFETAGVMSWDCADCLGTGKLHISKNTVVHAEMNALAFATKYGISTEDCTMYITLSPCIECAKMMIQCGIKEVVYLEDYRINHGVEFLKKHNITVRKLEEKDYERNYRFI